MNIVPTDNRARSNLDLGLLLLLYVKCIAVSIIVPIIVSFLFPTSVHVNVLSSSLKIRCALPRATKHEMCLFIFLIGGVSLPTNKW